MSVQPVEEEMTTGTARVLASERRRVDRRWQSVRADDLVAEECPVALTYNGISHAVMMATPCDLEDLGRGFSLSEGIIDSLQDVFDVAVTGDTEAGFTVDLHIHGARLDRLKRQHRHMAGPTGCGLCGKDSLDAVLQSLQPLAGCAPPEPEVVERALLALSEQQPIQRESGACHAAAWCSSTGDILLSREDVGRHNALDKLIGALAREPVALADGFALVSSRASYELVYKAVRAGMPSLVAVSGATHMAVKSARQSRLNLIGFARPARQVIYS